MQFHNKRFSTFVALYLAWFWPITSHYIASTKCAISGHLLLVGVVSVLHDVHVGGEGDVLQHDEHVRHRDPRQQQVDGVGPHVLHIVLSCGGGN